MFVLAAVFTFRRRDTHDAAANAIKPTTARVTATPSPAFAPVDRPLDGEEVELDCDELAVVAEEVEDSEVVVAAAASLTFHPTTPIAPIVERPPRVVEVIVHVFESVDGVDANVNVAPLCTSDRQSPSTEPGVAFARV